MAAAHASTFEEGLTIFLHLLLHIQIANSLLRKPGNRTRDISLAKGHGHHLARFQPRGPNNLLRATLGHGCHGRDWTFGGAAPSSAVKEL